MYEGSMYGAGCNVFAVWGYVISHMRFGSVELNPRMLSNTLGGSVDEIEQAIVYLTKPDDQSRHKEHEGRHMIQEGQFQYFIPSWQYYEAIRNEADRKGQNRAAQARHREKLKQLEAKKNGKIHMKSAVKQKERIYDKAVSDDQPQDVLNRLTDPPERADSGELGGYAENL